MTQLRFASCISQ